MVFIHARRIKLYMKKALVLALTFSVLTGLSMAQIEEDDRGFLDEEEVVDLEEPKQEMLEEAPVPARYVVGFIERLVPEIRAEINIEGEFSDEFIAALAEEEGLDDLGHERDEIRESLDEELLPANRSASITLNSRLDELRIGPGGIEDSNIAVSIDIEVVESLALEEVDEMDELIDLLSQHVEEGKIEYDVSGARNRIAFKLLETLLL